MSTDAKVLRLSNRRAGSAVCDRVVRYRNDVPPINQRTGGLLVKAAKQNCFQLDIGYGRAACAELARETGGS